VTAVPALDRAVAVVGMFAEHPNRRFTLSELARRLDMSKATAHSLLGALCEHGWLWRDPVGKTYSLGAALVALSDQIGGQRQALVAAASVDMENLASVTGARVVATTVVGEEIVMLAVFGAERPFGTVVHPGQRLPFSPPFGTVFLAWSDADRVDRWLRHHRPDDTDHDMRRHRDAIDVVRRRGYFVSLESPARRLLGQAISDGTAPAHLVSDLDRGEYVLFDLEPDRDYRVSVIAAPVFDERGVATTALSLFDLPDELPASRLVELADLLVGTARRVTKQLGGIQPVGTE
jgi:DNA-binding IclR family transcriptional regulator